MGKAFLGCDSGQDHPIRPPGISEGALRVLASSNYKKQAGPAETAAILTLG